MFTYAEGTEINFSCLSNAKNERDNVKLRATMTIQRGGPPGKKKITAFMFQLRTMRKKCHLRRNGKAKAKKTNPKVNIAVLFKGDATT